MDAKYIIQKTDGTPIDPEAVYFVLRIDKSGRADNRASRAALTIYIRESIQDDHVSAMIAHNLLLSTGD